jgi:hypothetical protein
VTVSFSLCSPIATDNDTGTMVSTMAKTKLILLPDDSGALESTEDPQEVTAWLGGEHGLS